jgi:hypothetical protein
MRRFKVESKTARKPSADPVNRMKRRSTKKGLSEMEILLADSLRLYFTRPRDTDEKKNEDLGRKVVALTLSMLMNFHMQLKSSRANNKRWISELTLADVSVIDSTIVTGHGELQWGQLDGTTEVTTSEDFVFKVVAANARTNRLNYEMKFGRDGRWKTITNSARRSI